jgi:uncharacterized membrane protein
VKLSLLVTFAVIGIALLTLGIWLVASHGQGRGDEVNPEIRNILGGIMIAGGVAIVGIVAFAQRARR